MGGVPAAPGGLPKMRAGVDLCVLEYALFAGFFGLNDH
jgi:hypothetical protein